MDRDEHERLDSIHLADERHRPRKLAGQTLGVTQAAYTGGFVFASINASGPGNISLTVTGGPLGVWSLEISGDLTNWSSFASLTNATGRVDFASPAPASNRFYRAILP